MKIRFDIFKKHSGKWGYGGEVEIGEVPMWSPGFLPTLLKNQREVVPGTIESGEWYLVTDNLPEDRSNTFYTGLFFPETLAAYRA